MFISGPYPVHFFILSFFCLFEILNFSYLISKHLVMRRGFEFGYNFLGLNFFRRPLTPPQFQ